MTMSVGAAAGAGVAAAAMLELMRQEEEEMTPYSDKDLAEGWEFKIVRSAWAAFSKPEQLRAVLEEEKKGGWILVEKFDDSRIRLKRPAGAKTMVGDFEDGYDPYRTMVGLSGEIRARIAVGVAVAVLLGLILIAIIASA
jgi:hypothetical protein